LERPSAKTGPETLQRESVRRMWELQMETPNGNSGLQGSESDADRESRKTSS
jgi:hypothetical protein